LEVHERPVLSAVARAATELTDAGHATLVAVRGQRVIVVAVAGTGARRRVGESLAPVGEQRQPVGEQLEPGDDTLSFVLSCGQSLSVGPADGDRRGDAPPPARAEGRPACLCVPCVGTDGVIGALELSGGARSGPFDIAATRVAELLAEIATAALAEDRADPTSAPAPEEIASGLARLAATDEVRYRAIAWALESLLAGG
jgi:GAF domain-containing protein